jgi:uncharacterized membrane protein
MALSKKTKQGLIIAGVSVSIILFLVVGVIVIRAMRDHNETLFLESSGADSTEPRTVYDSTDTQKGLELDSLNYDEANTESKVRKTGTVNLEVDNIDIANTSIMKILDTYQGSVVSSSQRGEGKEKALSVTLKIPVKYFEEMYEVVQSIDSEIIHANYYTDDVTQQYTDLESRLNNLESTETQLVKILGTAETVDDTLAVYQQLTGIRSQIEVIKGQLKYLDNQVDYSYLTVNLTLSDTGKQITNEQWKPWGVVKNAFSSLVDFGIYIVDALIWLLVFSPVVAIIVGIVFIVKKQVKSKK